MTVASSVSQKVSIQGEVAEPGVYQLTGPTTLLDVISMAKGETEIATLDQVVVFRNINGQRMGAVFDVASIRRGEAARSGHSGQRPGRSRLFVRDAASGSNVVALRRCSMSSGPSCQS